MIELKIRPVNGKELGLFAGRDEDELRWIAWRLREQLWGNAQR